MLVPLPPSRRAPVALAALAIVLGFGVDLLSPAALRAQRITVRADEYRQAFTGAGSSIPLYLFNHFQLPAAGRAEAVDLIARQLELGYLQDYPEFRPSDPSRADYFARRAEYFAAAEAVNPDVEISMVFSIFPDDLRDDTLVNGRTERRLDYRRPGIYDEVAGWYFEVLDYYAQRGITVDIVNAVNEPDFITLRYGFQGDSRRGTAELFDKAIGRLRELIADPATNTAGMPMPRIMGPSTIAPSGAVSFVNYYKTEAPAAWANIDIVSYHQYTNGTSNAIATLVSASEGRPVIQSEMHANRGDNLPALSQLATNHRGALSVARLFGAAVNRGTASWWYFLNVFPTDDSNPGLLQIQSGDDRPRPFKHYYAYRQLSSAQPLGSRRVERDLASIRSEGEVITFRPEGSDTVYVHVGNFVSTARDIAVDVRRADGSAYPILSYGHRVTDATRDDADLGTTLTGGGADTVTVSVPGYSVNTFAVALGGVSGLSPKPSPHERLAAYVRGGELVVGLPSGWASRGAAELEFSDVSGRSLRRGTYDTGSGAPLRLALPPALARGVYFATLRQGGRALTARVVW